MHSSLLRPLLLFTALALLAGCDTLQDEGEAIALQATATDAAASSIDAADVDRIPDPHALWFGPGGSAFAAPFCALCDDGWTVEMDLRPDRVWGTQTVLSSPSGTRFDVTSGGGLAFQTPGFVYTPSGPEEGTWHLAAPSRIIQAHRWQRVGVRWDGYRLRLFVNGQVVAETTEYADLGPSGPGSGHVVGTSFQGAIDRIRFGGASDGDDIEVLPLAEGYGLTTQAIGHPSGERQLTRAVWVPRYKLRPILRPRLGGLSQSEVIQ